MLMQILGLVAISVALITIIPEIGMPAAAAFEQRRIGGMDARITAPDTVEITVTATSTAGSLTAFVAGGAVFHVPLGRLAVVAPP